MVLDICPELYVGGDENLLWQPEKEETQRRRWLAPKEAPTPVTAKEREVPKAVAATTVAPAALSSAPYSYVLSHAPGHELSRTYAARSVAGCQVPTQAKRLSVPHQDDPKARSEDGCKHRYIDFRPELLPSIPAHNPTCSRAHEGSGLPSCARLDVGLSAGMLGNSSGRESMQRCLQLPSCARLDVGLSARMLGNRRNGAMAVSPKNSPDFNRPAPDSEQVGTEAPEPSAHRSVASRRLVKFHCCIARNLLVDGQTCFPAEANAKLPTKSSAAR
ncbi:Tmem189 [Symbiodinium sp. CCMP2456]|nr:Tmem189 [Symbiodinium sp. CCMP2456]